MSHRSCRAVLFILTYFAVVGSVDAQTPTEDAAAKQSVQSQSQAKQAQPAKATSSHDSSNPSPQPSANNSQPAASDSKPAPINEQSLPTIHVNIGPSADILRSARDAGFKIKMANGTTHFCKTEAPIGTRFKSERCLNEEQLTLYLSRTQDQRDQVTHMLGAPAAAH